MNAFQEEAARLALKKLFKAKHFSICDLDNVLRLTGCVCKSDDYNALRALHCIDYADMSEQFRQELFMKVMQIFERPGPDIGIIDRVFDGQIRAALTRTS